MGSSRSLTTTRRTYLVSSSIFDYYYTQLIGDPTSIPVLKASATFDTTSGMGMIDGDRYTETGYLYFVATNIFARQIRNLIFDTTAAPAESPIIGVHWPTAQATSIQNVVFQLSQEVGNKHVGIFMEGGSGGFMSDLVFYGGEYCAQFGSQQYTMRNLTFINCQTAIQQLWDWFWVYMDLKIVNCGVGINITASGFGSAIIMDSLFYNTPVAMVSNRSTTTPGHMTSQGSLIWENVLFINVDSILQDTTATTLIQNTGSNGTFVSGQLLVSSLGPSLPKKLKRDKKSV